ncbi:MAG: sigma-70 family RNA polymerase sigma factor [Bacteroidota bacterium]
MDTAQLLKEARQGSAAAQKCLFDMLGKKMLIVCLRYLKNEQDAEEAMLDGFYKFFKNLHGFTYNGDAALHGWLKKIMINECLMQLRKKNVFSIVTESAAEDVALEEEGLNSLSAKEILLLIVQLPVGYRTVFNLYVMEGMEHKEIAALLGIAEGTSKSQLSKAKILLQKNLAQHGTAYAKQRSK